MKRWFTSTDSIGTHYYNMEHVRHITVDDRCITVYFAPDHKITFVGPVAMQQFKQTCHKMGLYIQ